MKTKVSLRIRNDTKVITVSNLYSDSTLSELLNEICNKFLFVLEEIELLNGYPPKTINFKSMATTLSEANILSGDSLILKRTRIDHSKKPKFHQDFNTPSVSKLSPPRAADDLSQTSILITKTIPSDNSCLFASISYCINGNLCRFDSNSDRQMIAAVLLSDPEKFNEAYLDNKSPSEYSNWIMNMNNWGGAIELCLLSKLYEIEIDVVNAQYNRVDRFGENEKYSHRILILYDGIHYDALMREYLSDSRTMTRFPIDDKEVLQQAEQLAKEARASKQYTDLHGFSVKCFDCDKIIMGQFEVAKHANETGHSNFREVNKA